ncbi:Ribonuclease H2 subunit A [Penicillium longicatenatum]|uniref:Ribonuclease H2 subunit A n=1 Tax=Penicillium longicatenatum TaxID=1561947 RepID=UPI002549ABF8|nr:Ribonuclease H2 subunit A [Penicillium longicatenatum]KAJ5643100.1 Ribonuclease H2 subunit A [Penicillium longicatenatum]KAJ5645514.1 Ribonuclease H2 subunit A [Penicillium longicatenatum]
MKDNNSTQEDLSFIPPSVDSARLLSGESYAYYTPCPAAITAHASSTENTPCVLGVDEAGRGPVLGPMVYGAFYLPIDLHHSLLAQDHSFDDSKVLTPGVRANLMRLLNTPGNKLFESCGYAIKVLSARDISSGMLKPGSAVYNLNAQAMDATIEIIRGVVQDRSVNVQEVYIDTIGNPATYQQKLERIFPSLKITVAKKADSLYPCVSAASVAAKVTRDVALEVLYQAVLCAQQSGADVFDAPEGWGSGYPSDSKCVGWLRRNMDPVFGWGNECRFSWGTAKEMLDMKGGARVDWPEEDDEGNGRLEFLLTAGPAKGSGQHGLRDWYGSRQAEII